MKRVNLAGLLVMLAAPAIASDTPPKDAKAVEAVEQAVAQGIRAMNVAEIMKYYVPDDTLLVFDIQTPREYVGAKALKADWEDFFKNKARSIDKFEVTDLQVYVSKSGDLAASHEIQEAQFTAKDGTKGAANTRVTHVFKKIGGAGSSSTSTAPFRSIGTRASRTYCRRSELEPEVDAVASSCDFDGHPLSEPTGSRITEMAGLCARSAGHLPNRAGIRNWSAPGLHYQRTGSRGVARRTYLPGRE